MWYVCSVCSWCDRFTAGEAVLCRRCGGGMQGCSAAQLDAMNHYSQKLGQAGIDDVVKFSLIEIAMRAAT